MLISDTQEHGPVFVYTLTRQQEKRQKKKERGKEFCGMWKNAWKTVWWPRGQRARQEGLQTEQSTDPGMG